MTGVLAWNTARVCAGTVCVALALGVPLGLLLFRARFPGRRALLAVTIVSPLAPMPVVAGAWLAACGLQGWLTPALNALFGLVGLKFSIYNIAGAAWVMGAAYAPLVALVVGMASCHVPQGVEEDALLDASGLVVTLRVTLWQCAPGVVIAAILVLALSMAELTVTDVLVIRTLAESVYTEFQLSGSAGRVAAQAVVPTLAVGLFVAWAMWWARRWRADAWHVDVGGCRRWSAGVCGTLAAAGILALHPGLPVASLIIKLGSFGMLADSVRTAGEELRLSLALSAVTATLAVVVALPLAVACRGHRALATGVLLWVAFALVLPAPVVGVCLTAVLNRPGLLGWVYDSPMVLVAASGFRFLPFAVLICLVAASGVSREVESAATLDGAGWARRLIWITAPLCGRGMGVAWLLVFVLSMGELGASVLVAPPGRTTLAIRIFTFLHYGADEALCGICLVLLAATVAPALAMLWWCGKRYK